MWSCEVLSPNPAMGCVPLGPGWEWAGAHLPVRPEQHIVLPAWFLPSASHGPGPQSVPLGLAEELSDKGGLSLREQTVQEGSHRCKSEVVEGRGVLRD